MYLTSLELAGFKSFPDRIKIDFERGLTGIVGPNGSGKSNISDAVRWVLGEQSSKMLRGSRMEDVIFGGTEKRKPLAFAEVILTIDNRDRSLRADADVVAVGRRYYRSGDSEYTINKKQVRLKDVNELFFDTGLGRDGYSIIGQGRIDEVLSRKSEDRREIFEEAAGIAKFRYRKEDAERRLTHVTENLTRISDIVGELEKNLGPLRRRAEKAREYMRLYEELKGLEAALCTLRAGELKGDSTRFGGSLRITEALLEEAAHKSEALYDENNRLNLSIEDLSGVCEKAREALRAAEAAVSAAENDSNLAGAAIAGADQRGEKLETELRFRRERSIEAAAREKEKRDALADVTGRLASLEAAQQRLTEVSGVKTRRLEAAAEVLGALEQKKSGAEARRGEYRTQISAANAMLTGRMERVDALTAELAAETEKRSRAEEKQREIAGSREAAEAKKQKLANVRDGYLLMKKQREAAAAEDTAALNEKNSARTAAMQRCRVLTDLEREYEGFSRAVKTVMQMSAAGNLRGIVGTLASLVTVAPEYTLAIETALGGALQDIVTKTENDARDAIEMLKTRGAGRATFLPISAIRGSLLSERGLETERGFIGIASDLCSYDKALSGIFLAQLGRTVVADRLENAIAIAGRYGRRFRIVTLDGQVMNAGGSMTGGSQVKNAGILSRANEIRTLSEKIKVLDTEIAALNTRVAAGAAKVTEAEYLLAQVNDGLAGQDAVLSALEASAEAQQAFLQAIDQRLEALRREQSQTDLAARTLREAVVSLQQQDAQAEAELKALETELSAALAEKKQAALACDETEKQILEQRIAAAGLTSEKDAAADALEEAARGAAAAAADVGRTEAELAQIKQLGADAREDLSAATARLETGRQTVKLCEETFNRKTTEKIAAEMKRSKLDSAIREQNNTVSTLEHERNELSRKLEAVENELKALGDRMWESYELTIGEAAEKAAPLENRAEAQRRVAELKSRKRALGSVDLSSIEECTRTEERYAYLSAQKKDIEGASGELVKMIYDLTTEMTGIFLNAMETINANFVRTFKDLFGGGTAEIFLMDPADALNCGIEIRVCPPGKSLKFLSLLSGGEKAMVAIALYFAILRYTPSPFCILDEIDAALDEQNVVRFASYVEQLTSDTQFIVITHRRGTMDAMDRLYGVTMQEQGISRLIPVNMNEIADKIRENNEKPAE